MMKMEIRPADGGADADQFADELAHAVGKHAGAAVVADGTAKVLHRL